MKYINTNIMQIPNESGDSIILAAVLTESHGYAVYLGCGSDEWIMKHGLKLSYKEALMHFPMLSKEEYRR